METHPFDHPVSPGVRTLWMLKFKPTEPNMPKISVDLFIPSPFGNEWITANLEDNLKAKALLGKIQKQCDDLKSECKEVQQSDPSQQRLDKAQHLFKNFKKLDTMLKSFSDFMKRFYRIKPEEEENK
jgi:hypothetical protein